MTSQYNNLVKSLSDFGVSSPRLEAEILLEYHNASKEDVSILLEKRLSGMPVCKIVGYKGFYKHEFIVDENVLSPRPDTETILETSISILNDKINASVLELGIGSGCITLSLLKDIETMKAVGVDISPKAIEVANKNAQLLDVKNRFKTIVSSWFDESLPQQLAQKFDLLISNPPYIPSKDIDELDVEVRKYDPMLALDGGIDGLRDYRQIAKISRNLLKEGGTVVLEIGIGQARDIIEIFEKQGFILLSVIKDLAQIERCLVFV